MKQNKKQPVKAKSPTPVIHSESSDEDYEDDESEVPLDDLEDIHIDEDVVPKQRVEIDNEVGSSFMMSSNSYQRLSSAGCSSSHTGNNSA